MSEILETRRTGKYEWIFGIEYSADLLGYGLIEWSYVECNGKPLFWKIILSKLKRRNEIKIPRCYGCGKKSRYIKPVGKRLQGTCSDCFAGN